MQQMNSLFEQGPTFAQVGWRFGFKNKLNFLCDVCHVGHLQRERHAAARAHRVDCDWELRFFSVDNRLLE